jgi:hypothetical protein
MPAAVSGQGTGDMGLRKNQALSLKHQGQEEAGGQRRLCQP